MINKIKLKYFYLVFYSGKVVFYFKTLTFSGQKKISRSQRPNIVGLGKWFTKINA